MTKPPDGTLVKYLLAFTALGLGGIIGAHYVGGDALVVQVTAYLVPIISAVLIFLKGGEVVKQVEQVATRADENAETLARVDHAVNGNLQARLTAQDDAIADIQRTLDARLPPP